MANNKREEPSGGPQSDRWYDLRLGNSFKDDSSSKFCTLRYEFKPASIDKTKAGAMHKNKENRVSVEFQNNQLGKPKVSFEGSSEDYKEHDAVLFFDEQTFRLERLHRAVKQLRLLRVPGESASIAASSIAANAQPGPAAETVLSPPPAAVVKGPKPMHGSKSSFPLVPVEVEKIDVGEPQIPGTKGGDKGCNNFQIDPFYIPTSSPSPKSDHAEENQDIDIEEIFGSSSPMDTNPTHQKTDFGVDIDRPQNDTDDEIADVDDSGDEAEKGRNAAEALKEQVNAEQGGGRTSSSSSGSSGSGSESRSSSSSSSSSDNDGSDEDSVSSI